MLSSKVSCVFVLLLLVGCVARPRVHVQPLEASPPYSPTEHVELFAENDTIERPYREIALLSATGTYRAYGKHDKVTDALLKKAMEIGADAVIISRAYSPGGPEVHFNTENTAVDLYADRTQPGAVLTLKGVAIIYTE